MSRISRPSSFVAPVIPSRLEKASRLPSRPASVRGVDSFEPTVAPKRPRTTLSTTVADVVGLIPDGTVKTEGAADLGVVKLKGGASATSSTEADGTKVLKVEVHGSVDAAASGGTVGGSVSAKVSGSITVRLPPGSNVDPASIDPLDPATWPEGTEVRVEGDISGAASASLGRDVKVGDVRAKLKAQLGITGEAGVDVVIKKTAPNRVEVTVTPSQAIGINGEASVGTTIGGTKVGGSVSGDVEEKSSQSRTVEFDLSTPEGRAAFDEFERSGNLPGPGPGITKWKDVTVDSVTGKYEGEISVGSETIKLFGDDWKSTRTTTTASDGSRKVEDRIRNDADNATIVIERTFGPDGKEDVSQRKIRQELKVTDENRAQLEAMLTSAYGVPYDLKPGQTVSIELSPDDVQKMNEQVDTYGWDSFWTSVSGYDRAMHSELETGAEIEGTDLEVPNLDPEAVTRMAKDQNVRVPGTVKVTEADGSEVPPLTAEQIVARIQAQVAGMWGQESEGAGNGGGGGGSRGW